MKRILFHCFDGIDKESPTALKEFSKSLSTIGIESIFAHSPSRLELAMVPTLELLAFSPTAAWIAPKKIKNEPNLRERQLQWGGDHFSSKASLVNAEAVKGFYRDMVMWLGIGHVILWNGYHPHDEIFKEVLRDLNVPWSWMERGPFKGSYLFDREGILAESAWAKGLRSTIENLKLDTIRVEAFMEAVKKTGSWHPQPSEESNPYSRERGNLILFAGQVQADTQCFRFSKFGHPKEGFKEFLRLLNTSSRAEHLFIVGKHHPTDTTPLRVYQDILDASGLRGEWTDKYSMDTLLRQCPHVCSVNSGASFDALLYRSIPAVLGEHPLSSEGLIESLISRDSVDRWLDADPETQSYTQFRIRLVAGICRGLVTFSSEYGDLFLSDKEVIEYFRKLPISAPSLKQFHNPLESMNEMIELVRVSQRPIFRLLRQVRAKALNLILRQNIE